MSEYIDKTNFSDLKSCDPEEVIFRTGCEYDKTSKQLSSGFDFIKTKEN